MEDWEHKVSKLDPIIAKQIHDSAARAGLQSHDPAARMIGEMWVAVAALRGERKQLAKDFAVIQSQVNRLWIPIQIALGCSAIAALVAIGHLMLSLS
jgi:hypothetical protein